MRQLEHEVFRDREPGRLMRSDRLLYTSRPDFAYLQVQLEITQLFVRIQSTVGTRNRDRERNNIVTLLTVVAPSRSLSRS